MLRHWLSGIFVLCLVGLASGCGSSSPVEAETPLPGIDDSLETPLAHLLGKPRTELAVLTDEWLKKVNDQETAIRLGDLRPTLLPELRFPLMLPVYRTANYSTRVGFSLPPYASDGDSDADLALHLARHGDAEAAAKLAGEDHDLRARLEQFRLSRNYPVEWTRLVGLMQQSAQLRLATGEADGARELIALHRQVRKILGPQAAEGPLGAALLSRGHKALTDVVPVLRQGTEKVLADQISKALEEWGPAPSPVGSIKLGTKRVEMARLLGCSAQERVLQTTTPARALDLLALPLPADGVQAVTAFFDAEDRLIQVLVTYSPAAAKNFPEPAHLGCLLEDQGLPSKDASKSAGLVRRTYLSEGIACQILVLPRGAMTGGLVCFLDSRRTVEATSPLNRDFGPVHLDRGFEQNRVRLASDQKGETVQTKRASVLTQLANPLAKPQPSQAILRREQGKDSATVFTLRYTWDHDQPPLHQLVVPLWQKYGPARFDELADDAAGNFTLVWQDAKTRYTLRLPNAEDSPTDFVAQDNQEKLPTGRTAFDESERKARVAAGKPLSRLPRGLEGVRLGQTKEQAVAALPQGQSILKQPFTDGLSVTFNNDASGSAISQPRQLLFRLDKAGNLAEVRVRYQAGPGSKAGEWPASLLASLKKTGGAPEEASAPWIALWDDTTSTKPASLLTWQDDLTFLTFFTEGGVADVTLRDRPADHPEGAPLPALEYLPRGPESCSLGATKADLLKAWKGSQPTTTAQVDLILYPPKSSPYDAYLIWLDGDRVTRVVARHRPADDPTKQGSTVQLISTAWGRDLRSLSWPSRQEFSADQTLQGMGWLDDHTRIRLYWQESDTSKPRMFTEWKDLSGKTPAAKP